MFALSFASDRDSYSRNARACSKSFIPQVVASRLIIALKNGRNKISPARPSESTNR